MPQRRLRHFLFLTGLLLCMLPHTGVAQEGSGQTRPLVEVLRALESQHQIKFSFLDKDLQPLQVTLKEGLSLDAALEEIRLQTQLEINRLDPRYFTLSKPQRISVCGRLLDNFASEALAGATIEVMGSNQTATTDADGNFTLGEVHRDATLRLRFLGYKTRYLPASQLLRSQPCTTLVMSMQYQQLDEVVVYKFLTSGLSREPDGSIRMRPADFGLLPGLTEPDVLQSIQALPGIKSIDETVSDINIRGGTNDQNLLLWDGIKMYQSGHFFGLISAFNPYLTETVTLIKNGASARYGEGLSGIIRMDTFDEIRRTYFGGTGFNLISGDAYAHVPFSDRIAFQFSARRSVTDLLNTPTYDLFTERAFQNTEISTLGGADSDQIAGREESFYFYDFSGKLLVDLEDRHRLRLNFLYIRNSLFYGETLSDNSENQSDLDQQNFSLGGRLASTWNDRWTTEVSGYLTQYDLDSYYLTESNNQQLFQLNQVKETALKTRADYHPMEGIRWSNGYQFLVTGITNISEVSRPPFESRIKDVLYAHSAFTEWEYEGPEKRLLTTAGLRLNYLTNPGDFQQALLEPRLSLRYKLTPHLALEALGEFKNQTSLQKVDLEQNFLGIEKRRWILADQDSLPVVTSRQASLGLHYDRGNWLAGAEGFYKEVNGITTDTQGFQNEAQFNGEIGAYSVYGVETLLNYKSEAWSTWLSYALNRNTYRFPDLDPSEFPNNLDIRHTASMGTNYTRGGLKLGIGLNYRSGRPYTEPEPEPNAVNTLVFPNRINFQPPNSSRLPEYLRADASAVYSFALSETVQASVGASVLNLTNRKNILNVYYRLSDQNEVERIESISLGLTPNLSFRIRF
ncbi:carboxypeptidase-like regulatory domain-containing protein [Robiginitalea sp. M366]|uniref:TonB-dependent receptor n=1 Tax=Robiginitalea aestuariiviva TaxID=3036903 RepID=UPI00240D54D6|nr:carboxypeptidase-like regulatory domain-containing protein [Robiginitalea aestuariiviva]MDG1572138.1 carboxypeptidase-like regulatory domain-containing protein [Robiginitalea aestuariiviva]